MCSRPESIESFSHQIFHVFLHSHTHAHALSFYSCWGWAKGQHKASDLSHWQTTTVVLLRQLQTKGDPLKLHGILLGFATVNCLYTAIQGKGCVRESWSRRKLSLIGMKNKLNIEISCLRFIRRMSILYFNTLF